MKKNVKLVLSLLLAGSLTLNTTTYYQPITYANESTTTITDTIYTESMDLYQDGKYPAISEGFTPSRPSSGRMSIMSVSAQQAIYNGLANCDTSIDIASYQLTKSQVQTLMQNIMNTSPEFFYIKSSYGISTYANGTIASITPNYKVSGTTLEEQKTFYQNALADILSQIDTSWSDLEKILFTHDYLAQNFEYDTTYTNYDCYSFFKDKKGVCQAYTLTFLAVMKSLGIEASVASSTEMQHIWNVVELNDKWYHLDITWDDPLNSSTDDRLGLAGHNNLLLSDTAIATCRGGSSQYHYSWSCNYTCTDTTYDSYFWEGTNSPFQWLNDTWYYTYYDETNQYGVLAAYDFTTGQTETVTTLGKWRVVGSNTYYPGSYSGLDTFNQMLYYHTYSDLCVYNPADKTTTTVYTPDKNGTLYGMKIDDDILSYYVAATPNDAGTIYTYTLEIPEATPTPTPEPDVSETPSAEPTATPTPTPTPEPVVSVTPSIEPTATPTPTPTPEPVVSETPSAEPTATPTPTPTPEPVVSVTPSIEPTATPTPTPTPEPVVSETPSAEPTATPTATPTPTPTPEPVASVTPSIEPTATSTATPTPTPTPEPVVSVTPSTEPTATPTPTPTQPVVSVTPSVEPTVVPTTTPTPIETVTPSIEPTVSPSTQPTLIPIITESPTIEPTQSPVASHTPTSTAPTEPPASPEPGPAPIEKMLGDVNLDENVTLADAQLALKAALKIIHLEEELIPITDVDFNQSITLADAQLILKYALKIISSF